jgi:hypothetical protein
VRDEESVGNLSVRAGVENGVRKATITTLSACISDIDYILLYYVVRYDLYDVLHVLLNDLQKSSNQFPDLRTVRSEGR